MFKRISVFALACAMVLSLGASAFAADIPLGYQIVDKDGNIIEEGMVPVPNMRYTWSGLTLENGQTVNLLSDEKDPFYVAGNTSLRFSFTATSRGYFEVVLYRSETKNGSFSVIDTWRPSDTRFNLIKPIAVNGYYYFSVQNIGAERVTINSFHFLIN